MVANQHLVLMRVWHVSSIVDICKIIKEQKLKLFRFAIMLFIIFICTILRMEITVKVKNRWLLSSTGTQRKRTSMSCNQDCSSHLKRSHIAFYGL